MWHAWNKISIVVDLLFIINFWWINSINFIISSKKWILNVIDQCVMDDLMAILKQFNQNKTENEAVDIQYIK